MNLPRHLVRSFADSESPLRHDDAIAMKRFDALLRRLCPEAALADPVEYARITRMLTDRDWQCDPSTRARLKELLARARSGESPALPTPGPASPESPIWPQLRRELDGYLDFLRLRHLESELRHVPETQLHFDRRTWELVRDIEAALRAHQRQVREGSYAPAPAPMFRIH